MTSPATRCASVWPAPACWHGACVNGTCVCSGTWTQTLENDFWQSDTLGEMDVSRALCDVPGWMSLDDLSLVSAGIGYALTFALLVTARDRRRFRRQLPSTVICFLCALLATVRAALPESYGAGRCVYLTLFGMTQLVCVTVTSRTQVRYLRYLRMQSEASIYIGTTLRSHLVSYERGISCVKIVSAMAVPFLMASPLMRTTTVSRDLFQAGMLFFAVSNLGLSLLGGSITYYVMRDLVAALAAQESAVLINDQKMVTATKRAMKRLRKLFRLSVMMGIFDIVLLGLSAVHIGLALSKLFLPLHICFVQIFYASSRMAAKKRPSRRQNQAHPAVASSHRPSTEAFRQSHVVTLPRALSGSVSMPTQ